MIVDAATGAIDYFLNEGKTFWLIRSRSDLYKTSFVDATERNGQEVYRKRNEYILQRL